MAKTAKKESKAKGKVPSPYNAFMKEGERIPLPSSTSPVSAFATSQLTALPPRRRTEIARLKKNDPHLAHKDAFKQAAANWSKKKKGALMTPLNASPDRQRRVGTPAVTTRPCPHRASL